MNCELYQETDYALKKKYSKSDYILVLHKFENTTRNISTKLSVMIWDESISDGLKDGSLLDMETGEIILTWNNDDITYINDDYSITMTQHHFSAEDEEDINAHNDFINYRTRD